MNMTSLSAGRSLSLTHLRLVDPIDHGAGLPGQILNRLAHGRLL